MKSRRWYLAVLFTGLWGLALPWVSRTSLGDNPLLMLGLTLLLLTLSLMSLISTWKDASHVHQFLGLLALVVAFSMAYFGDGLVRRQFFAWNYERYRKAVQEVLQQTARAKDEHQVSLAPYGVSNAFLALKDRKPYVEIRTGAGGLSYEVTLFSPAPFWDDAPGHRGLREVAHDELGYWYLDLDR